MHVAYCILTCCNNQSTNTLKKKKYIMRHILSFASIPIFIILFSCTIVCLDVEAHSCVFDRVVKKVGFRPKAIVRELPGNGRSGVNLMTAASATEWASIRFGVFTEDLYDRLKYCTAEGDVRPTFHGEKRVCGSQDILTERKKEILVREIIPKSTVLHAERLLVQPVLGRIVVPIYTHGVCSEFTVPSNHHTEGVEGADVVLYVAAGVDANGGIAWAIYCSQEPKTWRPIVGVAQFNPKFITSDEHFVRTAAHEIAHILGFEYEFILKKGMIKTMTGVRGKNYVTMVNTLNTVKKAREHYKCTSATGMELEDEGGDGTKGSHWEMRNAKDEMMSGISGFGYYTSLTLALFEDFGFYRANWSMAETMGWGKYAGCEFLEEKCVTDGKSNYPDMFCTNKRAFQNEYTCTSDRFALGHCSSTLLRNALPENFQYFKNERVGSGVGLTDYCPYVFSGHNTWCASGDHLLGSRIGPNSKCFKGERLYYKNTRIGDVCAEIECNNGTLRVRYADNNTWQECSPGKKITPGGYFTGGHIVCPEYHEVCTEIGADKNAVDLSPMSLDVIREKTNHDPRESVRPKIDWSHGDEKEMGMKARRGTIANLSGNAENIDFGVINTVTWFHALYMFILIMFCFALTC